MSFGTGAAAFINGNGNGCDAVHALSALPDGGMLAAGLSPRATSIGSACHQIFPANEQVAECGRPQLCMRPTAARKRLSAPAKKAMPINVMAANCGQTMLRSAPR